MSRLVVCLALAAAALLWAAPARAVYSCGGQKDDCKCGKNNPYPCCSNGGNCTWWAWEAACCNWKVALPGWGNAKQWAGNAKAHGSYDLRKTPVAGSIAVRLTGYYGHVAWVKSVSGSKITVTEQNCCTGCNYGMRTKTYSASYFDGGFIVRKGGSCACTKGATQTQSCGGCGKQTRTCGSNCQWGSWSSCSGSGACSAGKVEHQPCGNCGGRKRTCSSKCKWGGWSSCTNQGVCASGKIESQTCGNCGTRKRTCAKCKWGAWGSCGQGECTPGKTQSQSCPDGGARKRTCGTGCTWGSWSACPTGRDSGATTQDRGAAQDAAASGDLPPVGGPGAGNMAGSCAFAGDAGAWTWILTLLTLCWLRRRARS